jgi:hypothetical protein
MARRWIGGGIVERLEGGSGADHGTTAGWYIAGYRIFRPYGLKWTSSHKPTGAQIQWGLEVMRIYKKALDKGAVPTYPLEPKEAKRA